MRRLFCWLLFAGLGCCPWSARSLDLRIASRASHAEFSVRLLWLHNISGRFTRIAGTLQPLPDGNFRVDARIAVDSLDMRSARFRRWVLAPEFFDAAQYPTIHFVSRALSPSALRGGGPLDGELTVRGTRRPVHFELSPAQCADLTAATCVIEARGKLLRSEFGMTGHHAVLSNEVKLALLIRLEHVSH